MFLGSVPWWASDDWLPWVLPLVYVLVFPWILWVIGCDEVRRGDEKPLKDWCKECDLVGRGADHILDCYLCAWETFKDVSVREPSRFRPVEKEVK